MDKNISVEEKIEYFRSLLANLDNDNENDILNLYALVNTYNTFDDAFFANENIYLADISEFIDVKLALKDELEAFNETLITWYLGALKSCDAKLVSDGSEDFVEMPLMVKGILSCTSLMVLASIMNKTDLNTINLNKLPKVKGAFILVAKLFQNHAFISDCMDKI